MYFDADAGQINISGGNFSNHVFDFDANPGTPAQWSFYKAGLHVEYSLCPMNLRKVQFYENKLGLYVGSSYNVNIEESAFFSPALKSQSEAPVGIELVESIDVVISDNTIIRDNTHGIIVEGTHPLSSGMQIGKIGLRNNVFERNHFGIHATGNDYPLGLIENNLFDNTNGTTSDGLAGTYILGESKSHFRNNSHEKVQAGLVIASTGHNYNEYNCNVYNESLAQSKYISGDNFNSDFYNNDFYSPNTQYDIRIDDGKLSDQGSVDESATNCFTREGVSEIHKSDDSENLEYYFFDLGTNCQIPLNSNVITERTDVEFDYCGISGIGINFNGGGDTEVVDYFTYGSSTLNSSEFSCKSCIEYDIVNTIDDIISENGDNPYTAHIENFGVNYQGIAEETFDDLMNYVIHMSFEHNEFEFIESVLIDLKKWKWQATLFGLYMKIQEYNKALIILQNMQATEQYQFDFKTIQLINIDRKIQGNAYSLNSSDRSSIEDVVNRINRTSGYAWSLYHLLTGEKLEIALDYDRIENRSLVEEKRISEIKVFPNPAKGSIHIDSEQMSLKSVKLLDLDRTVLKVIENPSSSVRINIEDIQSGIYLIECVKLDNSSIFEKVMINK